MNTPQARFSDVSDLPDVQRRELGQLARLVREQSTKVMGKLPVLGPAAWLLMAGPTTRHTLLSECEWRLMPPLTLDQIKLYLQGEKPVAFVTWARLSSSVAERYRNPPHHLTGSDWTSGDEIWLIDVVTPFGGAQDVLKDLREKVFPGQAIHQLLPVAAGLPAKTLTWPSVPLV